MTIPCFSQQQRCEQQIAQTLPTRGSTLLKHYKVLSGLASDGCEKLHHQNSVTAQHNQFPFLSRAELGLFRKASGSVRPKAHIPLIFTTSFPQKTLSEEQARADEGLFPGSLWQPPHHPGQPDSGLPPENGGQKVQLCPRPCS